MSVMNPNDGWWTRNLSSLGFDVPTIGWQFTKRDPPHPLVHFLVPI
jgi:hypothetical protein